MPSAHVFRYILVWLVILELGGVAHGDDVLTVWRTQTFELSLDGTGFFKKLAVQGNERNYIAKGQPAPLLTLRSGEKVFLPQQAAWNAAAERLTLSYGQGGPSAVLAVRIQSTHVTFELIEVTPSERVDLALWGPYPIDIHETVGEIVGVVRDRQVAVGIQSLNAKTIGGYPSTENDVTQGFSGDDTGVYPDLADDLKRGQGFRGDTARPTSFGCVLQAYARDRSQPRVIRNWGHERYQVKPWKDGGVVGSRIALFACREPQALETIGAIEVAEGLPHPVIDGVWGKVASSATASYLIVDFGESTIDRAIEMTRRAGLRYLYHSSPFATWGHFELKPQLFPNGWAGLKACVDKGRLAGVRIGFHTLSNFITPSDAHVTPEPDGRLAVIGETEILEDLSVDGESVRIGDPEFFRTPSALNAVRVGTELIRFSQVSSNAPWRLLGLKRGAWGTRAGAHARTQRIQRLLDHSYNVLFPDGDLSLDIARRIAALHNQTGALQMSFDGLEGNWASGYGDYGVAMFTKAWYDALDPSVRGQIINDASLPCHFNWHIHTRMNWGEPWYAGFRESQTAYRLKNQVLFERNLMPHMLGWFALRNNTSLEDAEWLLARAAGYDAGFALATSLASTAQLEADPSSAETAKQFGATATILQAIRRWETARMQGAFSKSVKALLRDNNREFELRDAHGSSAPGWDLFEVQTTRLLHTATNGGAREIQFQNARHEQPLQWIIQIAGKTPLSGLRLELNGALLLDLSNETLPAGAVLRSYGNGNCVVMDDSLREVRRFPLVAAAERVPQGSSKLNLHARPGQDTSIKLELRILGTPHYVAAKAREVK